MRAKIHSIIHASVGNHKRYLPFLKMSKSFVSELVCSIRKAGIPRLLIPQFIIEHNSRSRKSSSMMVVTDPFSYRLTSPSAPRK
jgi:hypothetical protein